jgi:hypothetical protein
MTALVVQKFDMAILDNDDLKAIKDVIEVTVEEVIERKGVVTKHADRLDKLESDQDTPAFHICTSFPPLCVVGNTLSVR